LNYLFRDLESNSGEPSKSELKKRAKAAEKEKKAAEKAAKLAEQVRASAEAEEVCPFFFALFVFSDVFVGLQLARSKARLCLGVLW
jgi:hypothetical protein